MAYFYHILPASEFNWIWISCYQTVESIFHRSYALITDHGRGVPSRPFQPSNQPWFMGYPQFDINTKINSEYTLFTKRQNWWHLFWQFSSDSRWYNPPTELHHFAVNLFNWVFWCENWTHWLPVSSGNWGFQMLRSPTVSLIIWFIEKIQIKCMMLQKYYFYLDEYHTFHCAFKVWQISDFTCTLVIWSKILHWCRSKWKHIHFSFCSKKGKTLNTLLRSHHFKWTRVSLKGTVTYFKQKMIFFNINSSQPNRVGS